MKAILTILLLVGFILGVDKSGLDQKMNKAIPRGFLALRVLP